MMSPPHNLQEELLYHYAMGKRKQALDHSTDCSGFVSILCYTTSSNGEITLVCQLGRKSVKAHIHKEDETVQCLAAV